MLSKKVQNISLVLLVFTIPLARLFNTNSYAVGFFFLVCISFLIKRNKAFIFNGLLALFFIYFTLICVSLITIKQSGIEATIIKYIPLILIPLGLLTVKTEKFVLNAFVYSTILSCIISIIYTLVKSKGYIFYYHNPTALLDIQLNYLSVFVCFSLAVLYTELLETNIPKLRHYVFIPVLFFSLAVFYNRTGVIISVLISLIFIFLYFQKYKNLKIVLLSLLFLIFSTIWVLSRPIVKSKFQEIINIDFKNIDSYNNGINSRLLSWQCSYVEVKKAGLLGRGINNTKGLLTNCYEQKIGKESIQSLEEYNSHNQFLQTIIDLGFLGFFVLITIYGFVLYVGLKHKDYLILFYFVIMLIFGITESFMNRQWGLIFFTFFTPFLLNRWDVNKR